MANCRLYTPLPIVLNATIPLSESATAHATRALRLKVGDAVILFNGDGFDYHCTLTALNKNHALCTASHRVKVNCESVLNITLLQGISSGERMDFTIQKAVELGVTAIQPIVTERSVVKLSFDRAEKRVEHWQNIANAACEQSGRAFVPEVAKPVSLVAWLARADMQPESTQTTRILLNPIGAKRLADLAKPTGEIALLIGAEGGLSQQEVALAITHHFQSTTLGKRILRTETAALTAIAAMQTLWGDF